MSQNEASQNLTNVSPEETSIEQSVELAKRAFALHKYEESVAHYATALELATAKFGEGAPEAADLYFSYGKALLENAISQSAVLGKDNEEAENAIELANKGEAPDAFLSFSGDAEDDDAFALEGEDVAVDLFASAKEAIDEADKEEGIADEDEAEPEDDFNAAWEVLEVARALYEKQKDDDDEIKLKLADTYIALGDVSLETEKFDQAIVDYTAGTSIKNELLPLSSRQIAEAHYKLSMVLDLTSGRLADAIIHAEKALESVEARLAELRNGLNGQVTVEADKRTSGKDIKGKGKMIASTKLVIDEQVSSLTKTQLEAEIKELDGLREDLVLKVDELKTTPAESFDSAPSLAAKALDKELNVPGSSAANTSGNNVVNDLSSLVVKKKKKVPDNNSIEANGSGSKRKLEEGEADMTDKRIKLDA